MAGVWTPAAAIGHPVCPVMPQGKASKSLNSWNIAFLFSSQVWSKLPTFVENKKSLLSSIRKAFLGLRPPRRWQGIRPLRPFLLPRAGAWWPDYALHPRSLIVFSVIYFPPRKATNFILYLKTSFSLFSVLFNSFARRGDFRTPGFPSQRSQFSKLTGVISPSPSLLIFPVSNFPLHITSNRYVVPSQTGRKAKVIILFHNLKKAFIAEISTSLFLYSPIFTMKETVVILHTRVFI